MSTQREPNGVTTPCCERMSSCELFPVLGGSGFLRVWQINYCENRFEECERRRRSIAGQPVPITLLPNGQTLTALARAKKPAK